MLAVHISSFAPHAHVLYGKGKTLNALEIVVTYIPGTSIHVSTDQ